MLFTLNKLEYGIQVIIPETSLLSGFRDLLYSHLRIEQGGFISESRIKIETERLYLRTSIKIEKETPEECLTDLLIYCFFLFTFNQRYDKFKNQSVLREMSCAFFNEDSEVDDPFEFMKRTFSKHGIEFSIDGLEAYKVGSYQFTTFKDQLLVRYDDKNPLFMDALIELKEAQAEFGDFFIVKDIVASKIKCLFEKLDLNEFKSIMQDLPRDQTRQILFLFSE